MSDITVVVVEAPAVTVVPAGSGLQGPPGPPGPAGSSVAAPYLQTAAAAVWTCPHNLGRYPSVTVTDGVGNVVEPDVFYVDSNIVRITHGSALSGAVYFN